MGGAGIKKKESKIYLEWLEKTKRSRHWLTLRNRVETVNGILHNHGLRDLSLRGLSNVRSELILHSLAHNFRRQISLGVT